MCFLSVPDARRNIGFASAPAASGEVVSVGFELAGRMAGARSPLAMDFRQKRIN